MHKHRFINSNKKKKMITDMILNVIAAALPLAMLQLIIYPILAKNLIADEYGLMITMYSLWLMISNTLGNVIFNVRLINNNEYEEKKLQGDFLVIVLQYFIVNIIIITAITVYYNHGINFRHLLLSLIAASLLYLKSYLDVGFRLVINFKAVTISGALVGVGFFLGSLIAIKTGIWEMVFIIGYLLGCLYAMKKSHLLREARKKTFLYRRTQKDCLKLTGASIIANLMTYADKLVLFPLMGGATIGIYYNATLLAKIVGMVTGPCSGVILTYLAKRKNSSSNSFRKMLMVGICLVIVGYFVVLLIARPIMGFLYPQWIDEIMTYIPVTTINVCILALVAMLNPFILKFCDLKWQMIISGSGVAVYFFSALLLLHFWGLMGFCFGTVIGSLTRLLLIIYVHRYNTKRQGG